MKKSITILTICIKLLAETTAEHNYYGDCDSSCHSCYESREVTAEHSWKPATCTAREACKGCGAVKGDLLEHSYTATDYDENDNLTKKTI